MSWIAVKVIGVTLAFSRASAAACNAPMNRILSATPAFAEDPKPLAPLPLETSAVRRDGVAG